MPNSAPKPIRAPNLSRLPWLIHGFSTRAGGFSKLYQPLSQNGTDASPVGQLNLGFTADDRPAAVRRNRVAFLTAVGAVRRNGNPWPLITLRQIHSDVIHLITQPLVAKYANAPPSRQLVGDGMITNLPGVALAVQSADCLPIVIADVKTHAIGVFHAGWRGTLQRIAAKGAGRMKLHFGSRFSDLRVAIGPGIGPCCYEVGEEIREKFAAQFSFSAQVFQEVEDPDGLHRKYPMLFLNQRAPGHGPLLNKLMLDLAKANRLQLLELGIPAKNIHTLPLCTACNTDHFFSHRAEFGKIGRAHV